MPSSTKRMSYWVRPLDTGREGELDLVVARSLQTILETIVELNGSAEEARRRIPNFDHAAMRAMYERDTHSVDTHRLLVAEDASGEVVGHALCFLKAAQGTSPTGYLFTIYVAPDHRRRGVADGLLVEALNWLERRGAARVQAHTHPTNQALLQLTARHGFVAGARREEPWPNVSLERVAPPAEQ